MIRRPIIFVIALALLVLPLLPSSGRATTVEGYCATATDLEFLRLINDYRRAHGLATLQFSQTLGAAAEHKAVDMGATGYLEHGFQDGTSWSQNIANHGYTFFGKGENIAWGYWTPQAVFDAWKASPTHNENMLWSSFRAIGIAMRIGYGETANGWPYWATEFGSTFDQPAVICGSGGTATPAPTATATATPAPTTPTATAPPPPPTATATPEPTNTPKPCRGKGRRACQ